MDLVCSMGVSSNKASEVVKIVLEKLAHVETDRLPSASFCKYMAYEARVVSYQHLRDALLVEEDITLGTDGTSKFGHKYSTAGVVLKVGTRLHLGLREQSSGSAQCTFETVQEMIQDIVGSEVVEVELGEKDIFFKN